MPKGRGSNHRRRNGRQKIASISRRIDTKFKWLPDEHPLRYYVWAREQRRRQQLEAARAAKAHAAKEADEPHTWKQDDMHKRSKKYWKKYDEKNPSRRIRGAKGNPTKGS